MKILDFKTWTNQKEFRMMEESVEVGDKNIDFKKLGYTCLGFYTWKSMGRYEHFGPTEVDANDNERKNIENFFNEVKKAEGEILGDHKTDVSRLSVKLKSLMNPKKFSYYIMNMTSLESVYRYDKTFNGKKQHIRTFYNDVEKYYYVITFEPSWGYDPDSVLTALKVWTLVKTRGIDGYKKYLQEYFDKEKRKEEEKARLEKIESERRKLKMDMEKTIEEDVRKNKEDYKEVKSYDDIPEDVRRDLESDNPEYFEYVFKNDYADRGYSIEETTYINNKTLSDGYRYVKKYIPYGRNHGD